MGRILSIVFISCWRYCEMSRGDDEWWIEMMRKMKEDTVSTHNWIARLSPCCRRTQSHAHANSKRYNLSSIFLFVQTRKQYSLTLTVWQVGTTHGRIVSRLQIPAHCDILDFTGSPMPAMGPQWLCWTDSQLFQSTWTALHRSSDEYQFDLWFPYY